MSFCWQIFAGEQKENVGRYHRCSSRKLHQRTKLHDGFLALCSKYGFKFVIIAIGRYIGEGFDFPRLDTLFLALPIAAKSKVTQYTGRLHRLYDGKTQVQVYDYVDVHIPALERMYYKRLRGYKSVGYKVTTSTSHNLMPGIIYGADNYLPAFLDDCKNAAKELIVSSPQLSSRTLNRLLPLLRNVGNEGVAITLIVTDPATASPSLQKTLDREIEKISSEGIPIKKVDNLHQSFALIDNRIVWYGGISLLGSNPEDEGMLRLVDPEVASAIWDAMGKSM